jgi:hypothetical protein
MEYVLKEEVRILVLAAMPLNNASKDPAGVSPTIESIYDG